MHATHNTILRLVAAAYFALFLSLYVQAPTLFGFDGVQPAGTFLSHIKSQIGTEDAWALFLRFPTLLWAAGPTGIHVDVWLDIVALAGVCISGAIVAGFAVCSLSFAACWLLYLSCYLVGQTFLSFQWDVLLLEVGFLAVWYAPLLPAGPRGSPPGWLPGPATPFRWLTRVLLFKLMLMAGAVKIQALCPSWLQLTALDYHFATQCIPTPLAWFAHQLPPAVQAWSVAATLVIELPATALLLSPFQSFATVGAVLQVLLQVAIAVTGNYNVFNALTAAMALALLPAHSSADANSLRERGGGGPVARVVRAVQRLEAHRWWWVGTWLVSVAGIAGVSAVMFAPPDVPVDAPWWLRWKPVLAFTPADLDAALDAALLPAVYVAAAGLAVSCMVYLEECLGSTALRSGGAAVRAAARLLCGCVVCAMAAGVLCASVVPLVGLRPGLAPQLPQRVHDVSSFARSRHLYVASGYGLFRRMTGMGVDYRHPEWGVAVPVVARPEVVLEGTRDGGATWHELEMAYKPGDVTVPPPWVAPHQPRVAWQMWFAALGTYQSAPWLVTLVDQVLEGVPAAMHVFDAASYPFQDAGGVLLPPNAVRASKWRYDFTRANTPWGLHSAQASGYPLPAATNTSAWWVRKPDGDYLPALTVGDASVKQFRDHVRAPRLTAQQRQAAAQAVTTCGAAPGMHVWLGPLGVDVVWFTRWMCGAAVVARGMGVRPVVEAAVTATLALGLLHHSLCATRGGRRPRHTGPKLHAE